MSSMKMHTPDLSAENVEKLLSLFPNVATETRDEKGALVRGVDWDLLRQELSDRIVEGPDERYRLDWPGKREAMLLANAPIAKTLRPCRDESVDFDTTKNLFIEGDNLDALKLLQETYLGKVKLIYIDPPYNTGNDFIYEDDFAEDTESYLQRSNQKDEQGNRLVANTESNGRFHSDWLNMMYPRLKLARNLLREDGVIFISIDDGEVANLRKMCDEIFGEENFIVNAIWQKRYGISADAKGIPGMHDHILVYQRSSEFLPNLLPRTEKQDSAYKNIDNDPRGPWKSGDLTRSEYREKDVYPIVSPISGVAFYPPKGASWRHPEKEMSELVADNRIWFGADGMGRPAAKRFLTEVKQGVVASAWWPYSEVGHTDESKKEVQSLFGGVSPFDTPKPTRLIRRILEIGTLRNEDNFVMDFFAGSGSFFHAALGQSLVSESKFKTILVQIPESLSSDKKEHKIPLDLCRELGLAENIAEITKERIRRAGKKVLEEWQAKQTKLPQGDLLEAAEPSASATPPDVGFRVLKIDSSNFDESFYKKPDEVQQTELLGMVDNIKPDRSGEDLLFQVLLDWGVDLSYPIVRESMLGKTVYFVNDTGLAACFDKGVSEELIRAIAARKPLRAVFRDGSFDRDDTKINTAQIFAQISPSTDVRTI